MATSNAERQRQYRQRKREGTIQARFRQAFMDDAARLAAKSVRTGVDELRGSRPATHQINATLPGEMYDRLAAVADTYDLKMPELVRIATLLGLPKSLVYLARCQDLIGKHEALDQQFISEVRAIYGAIDFAIEHAADLDKVEEACGRFAGSSLESADSATSSAEEGAAGRE